MSLESLPLQPGNWAHLNDYLTQITTGGSIPSVYVKPSGDSSGATDPTNVQAAINALRGIGGTVGLSGNYYFASGLTLYPGIGLVGIGPISQGTFATNILKLTSALNSTFITCVADPGNASWVSFPWLSDLVIQGTNAQTSQDAILISDANAALLDMRIDRVLIFDVGGNGLKSTSTGCKTWVRDCYFERCQQSGIRMAGGILQASGCYIQNNGLWGVDPTSSSLCELIGNYFWNNAGGGVQAWSVSNGGVLIQGNNFKDNGDNTHPVILINSEGSNLNLLGRVVIQGNQFGDSRASLSAAQYFVSCTNGADALITDNAFRGQKSGNPAVKVAANANNSIVIRSNPGFNAVGSITNPLDTTNNRIGLAGTTATAVASTDYTIAEVDQYLVVSGGTGVSITIKDPAGTTVESGLTTFAKLLPIGFKINFGAFSVAPTVASFGN